MAGVVGVGSCTEGNNLYMGHFLCYLSGPSPNTSSSHINEDLVLYIQVYSYLQGELVAGVMGAGPCAPNAAQCVAAAQDLHKGLAALGSDHQQKEKRPHTRLSAL